MEQLKKLKRKSLASLSFLILLMFVIGSLGIYGSNLFATEPEAWYLYDVPAEELEGSYVTVDLNWIYGCYAFTETYENDRPTGIITQQEYIIDANDQDYMCLILDKDWMEQADALLAECDAYYLGETDIITKNFTITGQVKALPQDSMDLYHEFIDYDSMAPQDQAVFLNLYLEPLDTEFEPVPLFFGLFMIGLGLFLLFLVLSGSYQKQIKKKLKQLFGDNTERADELLRKLMESPVVSHMYIHGGYILVAQGCIQLLLDGEDLVWAYKQTVHQKLYGIIPLGKTYRLVLKTMDRKEHPIVMKEAQVKEQLDKIIHQFPNCAIGYTDQMQAIYQKDPAAMRQVAAAQRQ